MPGHRQKIISLVDTKFIITKYITLIRNSSLTLDTNVNTYFIIKININSILNRITHYLQLQLH